MNESIQRPTAPAETIQLTTTKGNSTTSAGSTEPKKITLRKIMVSCIDSALEELGPLSASDVSDFKAKPLPPPATTTVATNTAPTAESLYGPTPSEPSKLCPDMELRGRMRRPRYQRRNSVTKFSLSCALKDVQKEDLESSLKDLRPKLVLPSANRQLWHQLYAKLDERHIMPSSALSLNVGGVRPFVAAEGEGPAAKRRRGLF